MVANFFLSFIEGIGTQPEHPVVDKASATKRLGKIQLLLWRWVKPKSVGSLRFHSQIIIALCKKHQRFALALYLPGLKAGVSREF